MEEYSKISRSTKHIEQDVAAELHKLRARVAALESSRQMTGPRRFSRWMAVGALLAVVIPGAAVIASDGNCPNGYPICFTSGTPARASDVNRNFDHIRDWLEEKVGPVNSSAIMSDYPDATYDVWIQGSRLETSPGNDRNLALLGRQDEDKLLLNVENEYVAGTEIQSSVNITGDLNVEGNLTQPGYQVSCAAGGDQMFPFCCRIDVRNGETRCKIATNNASTDWGDTLAEGPFDSTDEGRYRLSCFNGVPGYNFPTCCRIDAAGGVECTATTNWGLTAWGSSGTPF